MSWKTRVLSFSSWKTAALKILGFVVLLFRKKAVFALAFFTTFYDTFNQALEYLYQPGEHTLPEIGGTLVREAGDEFLESVPRIAEGTTQLLQANILDGLILVWKGFAAIYMLLFIYTTLFRGKFQSSEVEWPEKTLVLLVLVLVIALFNGEQVVQTTVSNIQTLLETIHKGITNPV